MRTHEPPLLDLTPEGQFRRPVRMPWTARLAGIAVLVALFAGGLAVAALAFWFALLLIPVAIVAAVIAYAALRFHLWRNAR